MLQGYPKRARARLTTDFVATAASATGEGVGTFGFCAVLGNVTGLTKYQAFGQPSLHSGTHDTRETKENMAAGKWSWNNLRWILALLNFHGGAEETQTLDSGRSA